MLWELLKEKLYLYGDQYVHGNMETVSYAQLLLESENLAARLEQVRYGICCTSDLNSARALLACFAVGAEAVPLPVRSGSTYVRRMIEENGIGRVICDEDHCIQVREDERFDTVKADAALLLYTSGSTGKPKGVRLSDKAIAWQLEALQSDCNLSEADKVLLLRGLSHCGTIIAELLYSLVCGAELFFYQEPFVPGRVLEAMQQHVITAYTATPSMLYYLSLEQSRHPKELQLRCCTSVGEIMTDPVLTKLREAFPHVRIVNGYGLTETCGRAFVHVYAKGDAAGCVGKTMRGTEAVIVDAKGNSVTEEMQGELLLRGNTLMDGYEADTKATEAVLYDSWFHTGDLAVMDADRNYYIKGRIDERIIRAGVNICPSEIEEILKKHRNVKEAAVYGDRQDMITEMVAAQVELISEQDEAEKRETVKELMALCGRYLPADRIPDRIEIVSVIPRNAAGKILRNRRTI